MSEPRKPLFTRRENGYGWDLNIGSRLSYLILVIILAIPLIVGIICVIKIKHN